MQTKLETVSPTKKKITVDVPLEKVAAALEKAYSKVQKNAELKGFRKGHVPKEMLDQYYSRDIEVETIDELIKATYEEAITKEGAFPVSKPEVTAAGAFQKDAPFQYSMTFEVRPEVTIEGYQNLPLQHEEKKVTEELVDSRLRSLQQAMTQLEPALEGAELQKGKAGFIDFKGTANGLLFKGGEATNFFVDIGSGQMLKAFEDNIIGMKKGDMRHIEFDYPADYFNKELAGKKGAFDVTLRELKMKNVPELNDDFAKDLGDFKTLDDVKKDIRTNLEKGFEREASLEMGNQAMEALIKKHQFEVPEAFIASELHVMFESFARQIQAQGKKFEESGITPEQFVEQYKSVAADRVRGFLILDAISKTENISVNEADIEDRLNIIATQSRQPLPKVREYYDKEDRINSLKIQILHEKTLDFIVSKGKISKKKVK